MCQFISQKFDKHYINTFTVVNYKITVFEKKNNYVSIYVILVNVFFIKILNVCHIINQIYNIVLMFFTLNDLSLFLIKLITRTCLMLLL